MKVGIVSKWSASGQAVVARQIRSGLEQLGHETFVLARPGSGPRAAQAAETAAADPVWSQPGVTAGSTHELPTAEYLDWVDANAIEAVLCDENYQFEAIRALRERGVRTIGRFVWEYFAPEHAAPTRVAYETVYALTRAEYERYANLGIESTYVQWGIHPELLDAAPERATPQPGDPVRFWFPGSFLGKRKPIRKVIKALGAAAATHAELVISAQVPRNDEFLREAAATDPRIILSLEDLPEASHRREFAAADVLLAPTRWEGLGLPLYEATAFGMPIITNDKPPMSEMVIDGRSGILVGSTQKGTARSGIPAWNPDVGELAAAIERLADPGELARMREGVAELRLERSWGKTVDGLAALLGERHP